MNAHYFRNINTVNELLRRLRIKIRGKSLMDAKEMELWKQESIKQAEAELYGELLASYSEMPFVGRDIPLDAVTFGEGWR